MVELKEIKRNEIIAALIFHRIGFLPTFVKYKDRTNPVFRTFFDFIKYYKSSSLTMFWIIFDSKKVGQIWIKTSDDCVLLARIFVLKKWQNKGIAQQAILQTEKIFAEYKLWKLDTIMQEKKNCHLYEKLGYKQTGHRQRINNKMTVIDYEKEF